MPYYIFKYENTDLGKLKEFELLAEFDVFKAASKFAKVERIKQINDTKEVIKVMFAESVQSAEEMIREKREAGPLGDD